MNEIRAKKRVKFTNIKMSHQKIQNEPRWLMSHRLGTPAIDSVSKAEKMMIKDTGPKWTFSWVIVIFSYKDCKE